MAYENALTVITAVAGTDLSAKQYYFVTLASDGQIDPSGDGDRSLGVLQDDPSAAGQAAAVAVAGISKVVAGGNITVGQTVTSTSTGKAKTAASGDVIMGIALATSSGDGQIIPVLLQPGGTI